MVRVVFKEVRVVLEVVRVVSNGQRRRFEMVRVVFREVCVVLEVVHINPWSSASSQVEAESLL